MATARLLVYLFAATAVPCVLLSATKLLHCHCADERLNREDPKTYDRVRITQDRGGLVRSHLIPGQTNGVNKDACSPLLDLRPGTPWEC